MRPDQREVLDLLAQMERKVDLITESMEANLRKFDAICQHVEADLKRQEARPDGKD